METPRQLTPQDIVLLQWLADGKRDDEIAQIMNTTPEAVNMHAFRVRDKTGTNTRAAAVATAIRQGLIK